MDRLRESVNSLASEVRHLRDEMHTRPTREEVERARKLAIVRMVIAVLWIVLIAAFIQDQHLEKCGAGARAENIIEALRDGEITSQDDFNVYANRHLPAYCDISAPLHAHDLADWPTSNNAKGFVAYGAFAVLSVALVRPRRWEINPVVRESNPSELVLPHEDGEAQDPAPK